MSAKSCNKSSFYTPWIEQRLSWPHLVVVLKLAFRKLRGVLLQPGKHRAPQVSAAPSYLE